MPSAIVIGSDPNGLAAALVLAGKGWDVQVLEPGAQLGSFAASEEFAVGYRTAGALHDDGALSRATCEQLGLTDHGLQLREQPTDRWVASDDGGLLISADIDTMTAELVSHSQHDAEQWPRWRRFIERAAPTLRRLLEQSPPDILDAKNLRTGIQVARAAISVRALGKEDMFELLRAMPMAARDFADDWFESELLKAGLVGPGLFGTWGGPWSPGGTTPWLLREAMLASGARGGPAAVVDALIAACKAAGVRLATNVPINGIEVASGAIAGVVFGGELTAADAVLSSLDPRATLLDLVHPAQLPLRLDRHIQAHRSRGIVATLALALDRQVQWKGASRRLARAQIGGSIAALEKAFDPVKYGEDAVQPWLDVLIPTVEAPHLAPAGHEVMTVMATGFATHHHAPDEARDAALEVLIDQLAQFIPDLRASIVAAKLRLPEDLARDFGLSGGHLWQGEHALDQLLSFRPSPLCAAGPTPIAGLYLCGGGIHPGGGINCVAGALAAKACAAC